MAHLAPEEAFEILKNRVTATVQGHFPIEGKERMLSAKRVWVDDNKDIDDIRSQKKARLAGRAWSVPIRAELELKDKRTGKVTDRQAVTIAQLPKITRRYSYIVGGNEWQVNNLFKLKPGVYTHAKATGEIASQWNMPRTKGLGFEMNFDPNSKKMTIQYKGGKANIPLYPLLKTLGVDDDVIERRWGKEILSANKALKTETALRSFYRTFKKENPEDLKEAQEFVIQEFDRSELDPKATQLTLGKPFNKVTGKALLEGSSKILRILRQEDIPDDRDSLQFKDLASAEDMLSERLAVKNKRDIRRKLTNPIDNRKKKRIRDIIHPDIFGRPIRSFFTSSAIGEQPVQTNPMSFIAGNRKTTILAGGEGGISTVFQVTPEAKLINPSHLGFLDPIQTPEARKTGVNLQLALGVKKVGDELRARATDPKTGKVVWLTPGEAIKSNLAFPDQYKRVKGRLVPISRRVKVSDRAGEVTSVKPSDVDYVLQSSKGLFDISANLIPFLSSNQGNRAMMAVKQGEQSIALVDREAPLVQVKSDSPATFEDIVGKLVAHPSPADGTVERVGKDSIFIRDTAGHRHEVQLYNDFPLNDDKSYFNSFPIVKKGDQVKKGQVVADNNFTKDGTLALGKNLSIAYMPWKGYNFEDGIVISDTAAGKLTSDHMYQQTLTSDSRTILKKGKYNAELGTPLTTAQLNKLDDEAVVKKGETVEQGDVLIGALKREEVTPEQRTLGLFSKKFIKPVRVRDLRWNQDTPGVVADVVRAGKKITVFVKTKSPAVIGDKIVGRHANKGIITKILPDGEMPHDKDGNPIEVLLNPTGVPSRINLGQVLETAASKIAQKTGKPYVVNNFDPTNKDYTRSLQAELKRHGLSDTEELHDPVTKRKFPKVLTGPQYMLKLHHTAAKGLHVRSRGEYDSNMQPRKGGPASGQTMDAMGLYAMLAHNARENIREMQTYKSDHNDQFWNQLQAGESIPTPKEPFAYTKFEGYLRGVGLDVQKDGNDLILQPLTDEKTRKMSNGELRDPKKHLKGVDLSPEKGGIFDPEVTGNNWPRGEFGKKWSHIVLGARMPNPIFAKPISKLLGISTKAYNDIIRGVQELDGTSGPTAIVSALGKLDIDGIEKDLKAKIPNLRRSKLNNANQQLKYVNALKRAGLNPTKAYTMSLLPVMPPVMRPVGIRPDGQVSFDDINRVYQKIGATNEQVRAYPKGLPPEERIELESELYDGLRSLMFTGTVSQGRQLNSIKNILTGKGSPKGGFFQKKVIGKRQDMSMRGTIVPEPSLNIDEVSIPRVAAKELYKPLIIRHLVRSQDQTPLRAQEMLKEKSNPSVESALELVIKEHPLLLKRDPVLHKYGVQAFRPVLSEGKVIKIHPLATSGYNADFDGDKMSAYVPIHPKAVKEAFKMMPSANLFSPSTGSLMFKPTQESMFGLYKITEPGKETNKRFSSPAEAARAVADGIIGMNDLISIDDIGPDIQTELAKLGAKSTKTSVGRLMVYQALPEKIREQRLLTDKKFLLDAGNLRELLSRVAREDTASFGDVADKLKNIGNKFATGMSIGLEDFESDHVFRDAILRAAEKEESKIRTRRLPANRRDEAIVKVYQKANDLITDKAKRRADVSANRMYDWVKSKARGKWDQYKQMTVAPMLVVDSKGKTVPIPITKSYSEGLDIGSYWAAMHGARMGTVSKAEGTWKPGLLGKQITQTTMNQMVVSDDCGTSKGVSMPIADRDILDRYTAVDIPLGKKGKDKGVIPAGTLITPEVINRFKNNKLRDVSVRSPLRCAHGTGLCAKCYGLNEDGEHHTLGTNVGIIASQALGEPATQLSMNSFHEGGVVGAKGSSATGVFNRMEQLVGVPEKLPGAATLAQRDGKVEKIVKDPAGGWSVVVEGLRHHVPAARSLKVARNSPVKRGDALSSGPKNPQELLPLTSINTVQRYLTDEIFNVYKNEGPVRRRNIETFVRAMTNLSEVQDPGDHEEFMMGDHVPTSEVQRFNSRIPKGGRPILHDPLLKGVSLLPQELQTDWLARMQSKDLWRTVTDAAAEGWKSAVHSTHPIPGMAYATEFGLGTPEKPWLY